MPLGEHGGPPLSGPGAFWLPATGPRLVRMPPPWQGSRVISQQVRGVSLNARTCMPLRTRDLGLGYGRGQSVYSPEAPLPESMAQPTCVHTLMCLCTYICFVSEWQGSWNALFYDDTAVRAVLCQLACMRVCRSVTCG